LLGRRVVRDAIAVRVWGTQQAVELASLKAQMTGEQHHAVVAELIPAINSQQIRV
jgi:hypothetical protein